MKEKIRNYIHNMDISDINSFAIKNDIYLSKDELLFTFNFIKNNYEDVLERKNVDINKYQHNYSKENFPKIVNLINKYSNYL